ncbi:MAG: hypothetical protein Q7R66_06450 [Undibacterium sp.]|uniref:hypothetical protein n=1 Tax=Undibacterium sp. TaxID=1914977 RepID=UPI002726E9AB|nr:hypothetical protein [Undibacterium sp.]MDO8651811.1 hypothetical protein [Undibacterium sp.]
MRFSKASARKPAWDMRQRGGSSWDILFGKSKMRSVAIKIGATRQEQDGSGFSPLSAHPSWRD